MAAGLFDQGFLIGSANVTGANAGKYDGTGSQVVATGTTAPGAYVTSVVIACQGSNNANTYRFFLNDGTHKRFLWETTIPKNDALSYVKGVLNPAQNVVVPCNVPLSSASYTLEVNAEVAGNSDVSAWGKSLT